MLGTPSGIVTLAKLVQFINASVPMLSTPSGIVTLVKLVRLANAKPPMLVTEYPSRVAGIVRSVALPSYSMISAVLAVSSITSYIYPSVAAEAVMGKSHAHSSRLSSMPSPCLFFRSFQCLHFSVCGFAPVQTAGCVLISQFMYSRAKRRIPPV